MEARAAPQDRVQALNRPDRAAWLGFALAVIILFFVFNSRAYKGFFIDDDFDHIANARSVDLSYYGRALIKPSLGADATFRPAAHFYYFVMARTAGLNFRPYIAGIQILHLLNVLLVWMLVRALGAEALGAAAAALLFAVHMAVFKVHWEPMYIFDLACGTFTLLCLLSYVRGRVILSLICFWLALKAKEVAIMLPLVLLGYEWWFGGKRWRRLIPFFAISAALGVMALVFNVHRDTNSDYTLRFTPAALWKCARFYAGQLVLAPAGARYVGFAGFAILALPFFIRDRRVRFGVFSFVCLLGLMLFLPGRLFGAYLYVPLIGLAIAISAATRPVLLALFFAVWIPWNYNQLRVDRRAELAAADERRAWFQPVANFMSRHPETDTFIYDGAPDTLAHWGVKGILRNLRDNRPVTVTWVDASEVKVDLERPHVALLIWNPAFHTLRVVPRAPDVSYILLSPLAPRWQFGEGWIGEDQNFRWTEAHATARLLYPSSARKFEVVFWVRQIYLDSTHKGRLQIAFDHRPVGTAALDKADLNTFRFDVPPGMDHPVEVEFDVSPALKDPGGSSIYYGAAISAFGFVP